MIIFVKLLFAHLLGDFLLQPNSWVVNKELHKHKSKYLYFHIILHGILAAVFICESAFIWLAIVLAILHGFIDFLKLTFQKPETKRSWFVADQILHLIVLILISALYTDSAIDFKFIGTGFWTVLTGIVLLTKPTSVLIKNIISIWAPDNKDKADTSLANAGNYIGILERLFVFCFIITGHFEAIGFLLAAKSIFRFGDLMEAKERKLTEYVLIGTLLSFGIALLTGLLGQFSLTFFQ